MIAVPSPQRVQLLDPHTINQIAAGEVVERPASVVKELVENALDAGSTRLEIELEATGRRKIRISDNGIGMNEADVRACLLRHATSKIRAAEDLLRVSSLGFRGEAIPSIASVSRFTLSSATEDGARFVVRLEGGQTQSETWEAGPKGTEITVEDLFFNVPARLKFLKSDGTELGAILDFISKYAMAYPHVAFSVIHDGQVQIQTTGSGDLFTAVAEVWGRETAGAMVETATEGPRFRLDGFISPPHLTRPTRAYQYVFVNGRPVRTRTLTAALDQAYRDLTPEKRYPMVVLRFDIDPDLVDVNVSPTKSEVKFQYEGMVFDAVRTAVRGALLEAGMMPDAAHILQANQAIQNPNFTLPQVLTGVGLSSEVGSFLQSQADEDPFVFVSQPSKTPFAELLNGLKVIGQAMNTFILAETARGLVIIDQHVAHERVIYEYLCGVKGKHAIERQPLLVPATLELDRSAAVLLREQLDEVNAVGFDLEEFGGESFLLRGAPAALRGKDPLRVLRDLVDELVATGGGKKPVPTREQIWIMSSCKMAVKAGDPLSLAEMEKLIVDLAATENPYLCPHGRPITVTLAKEDLLKKFYRL
jgi:DNA mismatch repair protein MutL